ncbi:phosphatidic acid phosphatase type 2/haloperoxidase [Pelagophyceae sp. CCMP2097]|nr:phosphatidic acid phosphatase type 2/haloperoxidase [Pelagophyceae sp. CCMP2097]
MAKAQSLFRDWLDVVLSGDAAVNALLLVLSGVVPLLLPLHTQDTPTVADGGAPYLRAGFLASRQPQQQIVPTPALGAMIVVVSAVVQLGLSRADAVEQRRAAIAARLFGLAAAVSVCRATTECLKLYVGYWRPYFYDVCTLDAQTGACDGADDDAFKSFPSGHASLSMVALFHASLCLAAACRCGAPKRIGRGRCSADVGGIILMAAFAPAFLALWVAATRVREHDHHPADIVGGALLGASTAALFYYRYFPSIFHADAPVVLQPFRAAGDDDDQRRALRTNEDESESI